MISELEQARRARGRGRSEFEESKAKADIRRSRFAYGEQVPVVGQRPTHKIKLKLINTYIKNPSDSEAERGP